MRSFFFLVVACFLGVFFLKGAVWALQGLIFALFTSWDFLLYWLIPTGTIILALSVMLAKNPINSLFCLIGVFLNAILILLSIRVEFLSMIFLIVYLGAIAILFLFVIMLLNLKNLNYSQVSLTPRNLFLFFLFAGLSFRSYFYLLNGVYVTSYSNLKILSFLTQSEQVTYQSNYGFNDILLFSNLLYTEH